MGQLPAFFCLSCYFPSYVVLRTWHRVLSGCPPDFMVRGIPFPMEGDFVLA